MPTDTAPPLNPDRPTVERPHAESLRHRKSWRAFNPLPRWYRGARWVIHRVVWRLRALEYALLAIERELSTTVEIPWWRKPGLWRRGFLSESFVLYDLARNDWRHYLSDLDRSVGVRRINGDYGVVLDDKLIFERILADMPTRKVRLFGMLDGTDVIDPFGGNDGSHVTLQALLARHGKLVLKPARGGGGRGVVVLEDKSDEGPVRGGESSETIADIGYVPRRNRVLVYEHVTQHGILSGLYPGSLNTVRVITMRDSAGSPFAACAVLRIGTNASKPTDNWIRGGLCAAVDLETGTLGPAVQFPANTDKLTWLDSHPDTGTQIRGVIVPNWDDVLQAALEAADSLPEAPYVGWDVAVAESGPKIIEGNSYSGVNLFQVHAPLLGDSRIRKFFESYGIGK